LPVDLHSQMERLSLPKLINEIEAELNYWLREKINDTRVEALLDELIKRFKP